MIYQMPKVTRKDLFNATTKQLYTLHGQIVALEEKIKAELICRGDY